MKFVSSVSLSAVLGVASLFAAPRPNVLFIAVDDLRPELGCYGVEAVHSPHLDRLAAEGRLFERAYCQYAICGPSRASLLTGLRPSTLKIDEIDTYFRNTVPDCVTLPQHFRQHGYETLYIGKVFHPGQTDDANSWSRRVDLPGKGGYNAGAYMLPESRAIVKRRREEAVARYGPESLREGLGNGPAWEAADLPDSRYLDGRVADGAINALRELKDSDRPFFLGVGFHKPHLPFVAPKKYFDLYDPEKLPLTDVRTPPVGAPTIALHKSFELRSRTLVPTSGPIDEPTSRELLRAYYACTSFIDAQIGRVIAELERLGLRDNTIIVVWGDHGWHLGEYGIWGKATNFEVATRVPLIVWTPDMAQPGRSTRALVEFVDLYPTLCELAGLPVPAALEGSSFVAQLRDPAAPGKPAAFSQFPSPALREWAARPLSEAMRQTYFGPIIEEIEARLKAEHGERYDPELFNRYLMGYSMRTDRYRFTAWLDDRDPFAPPLAVELYDHRDDPRETRNIASAHPELVADLLAQLRNGPRGLFREAREGAPVFREAAGDVLPLEDRSRRKWDNAFVADLDRDGRQDLVLTEHGLEARVYWNEGGRFSAPEVLIRGDTHGLAAGDYDRDGLMDVIVYPGGGGGKKPRNPVAFHVSHHAIEGGEAFADFIRTRGRAVKLVDWDGDGWLDLVATGFPMPSQKESGANFLYRNTGDGNFAFAANLPPTPFMGFRAQVTDFNSDGRPDLLLYGGNRIVAVENGPGMSFRDVTEEVFGPLAKTDHVTSITEIDYDNDGDFDLFLTRADYHFDEETAADDEHGRFAYYVFASFTRDVPYQYDLKIKGDFQLENLQTSYPTHDVFVGADARKIEFDVDRHGGKTLRLTAKEAAGWPAVLEQSGHYIGYLGDGMWRLGGKTRSSTSGVVLNVEAHPPVSPKKNFRVMLLENRGGVFADVTDRLGIVLAGRFASAAAGDFDNDGWCDLFLVPEGNPARENEQLLLHNRQGERFATIERSGIVSGELGALGGGAEVLDYDEDGRLDIIYGNERGRWHLYHNETPLSEAQNYIVVKVGGSPSGQATELGAVLTIEAGGRVYRRVVGASSAAFSQPANNHLHVGLGRITKVDRATVRWSNGEQIDLEIGEVNRRYSAGSHPKP